MRRLIDLYATQVHILWDWRGGPVALAKRLLLTAVVATVAFGITAAIMPGVRVDTVLSGVLAIFLVALFNALIRPVLLLFVAPRSLILTAVVVLVLQVVAFYLVATLSPGVHVDRITTAIIALVRVRGDQHGVDGDPRGRLRRLLLRDAGAVAAREDRRGPVRQAGPRDRPDRRPRPPDHRGADPRRDL